MLTLNVVHTGWDLTDLTSVPDRRAGFLTGSFSTPCILSQGGFSKTPLSVCSLGNCVRLKQENVMQQCDLSNGYHLSSEKNTSIIQYIP